MAIKFRHLLFCVILASTVSCTGGIGMGAIWCEKLPNCITDTECQEYAIEQGWPEERWP